MRTDLQKSWIDVQPLYFQCLQIKFPFKIKVVGLDEIKGTWGKMRQIGPDIINYQILLRSAEP